MIQQKLRERMINFLRHTVNCEVTAHENLSLAVRAAEISSCLEDLDPRRDLSLARPGHTLERAKWMANTHLVFTFVLVTGHGHLLQNRE